MSGHLRVERLLKRFGDLRAVNDLSFELERGEILALLGPSGSGKTTTLRLLAGFDTAESGQVIAEGEDVTMTAPAARRFGMVFQHYALFPHLDVFGNVAFGLETKGLRGSELAARVAAALALVNLAGFERRRIGELSGGQQQRVALARALAPEPRVLLLDEPLSNLDPALRERTRLELRDLIRRAGITTVIVTHEQEEAFDLGDRIAVLRDGRLMQIGTADELYDRPANEFVAGFIGRSSALDGRAAGGDAVATYVEIEEARWNVRQPWSGEPHEVRIIVRPEGVRFSELSGTLLASTVTGRRFNGAQAFYRVTTSGGNVIEVSAPPDAARVGDRVGLEPQQHGIHLFPREGR